MASSRDQSSSSREGLFAPSPGIYARHAISTLGVSNRTTGYWPHTLQVSNMFLSEFLFLMFEPSYSWNKINEKLFLCCFFLTVWTNEMYSWVDLDSGISDVPHLKLKPERLLLDLVTQECCSTFFWQYLLIINPNILKLVGGWNCSKLMKKSTIKKNEFKTMSVKHRLQFSLNLGIWM